MRRMMFATAMAVALCGCQRQADTAADQQQPAAPAASELAPVASSPATQAAAAPASDPATPEAAAQEATALDSAPPGETYDFQSAGAQVRAAEDPRRGLRLTEGQRTYFYRPGEQTPYLVREGDYEYAYRGGALSGVLDRQGRRLPDTAIATRRAAAQAALDRARVLHAAADSHTPRRGQAVPGDRRDDGKAGDDRHGPASKTAKPGDDRRGAAGNKDPRQPNHRADAQVDNHATTPADARPGGAAGRDRDDDDRSARDR